jgi:hypothetical protein
MKAGRRILKSDEVKLEGRVRLDAAQAVAPRPKAGEEPSARPQVRIVQNQPQFAVIEVICSCGVKTRVRCEYVGVQSSPEGSRAQNGAVGEPDQVNE